MNWNKIIEAGLEKKAEEVTETVETTETTEPTANKRQTKIEEWIKAVEDELEYLKPIIRGNVEKYPKAGAQKAEIVRKLQDAHFALLDIEDIF